MRRSIQLLPILLTWCLAVMLIACGEVGDAPQAQTGAAVALTDVAGEVLLIDTSRSTIKWRAAKVTRAHDGGFRRFNGTVTINEGEVTGVNLIIDATSIWSDSDRLTGHLKNEDFFAVETYPTATFRTEQITPADSAGASHVVTGNLSMHGQTKSIAFPMTITQEDGSVRAAADFIINRTNWGINYRGQADDLIEEHVRLIIDVVAAADPNLASSVNRTSSVL